MQKKLQPPKKRGKKKQKRKSNEVTDGIFYDDGMSRPTYINVGSPTSMFEPVIDVSDAWFSPRKTTYQVSFDAGY